MDKVDADRYGLYQAVEHSDYRMNVYIDRHNQRVKLLEYEGDAGRTADRLIELCRDYNMGKVICTIPETDSEVFVNRGYVPEGVISRYFRGEPARCVSYFGQTQRAVSRHTEKEDAIIEKAREVKGQYSNSEEPGFIVRTPTGDDAEEMAGLFGTVFKTYPTPMDSAEYIRKVIGKQVMFKVVEYQGRIVSAASADMNIRYLNAEITDCATLEEFRGRGLLSGLIYQIEQRLKEEGFIALYSLSRALSAGINIVLSKHGYEYAGRLINNCNIMGKFEDMNIWEKSIN